MKHIVRKGSISDAVDIFQLYSHAYDGTYPDPSLASVDLLEISLSNTGTETDKLFFCIDNEQGNVIACLMFFYNEENKLSKAGAAVVHPSYRGQNCTTQLLEYGIKYIQEFTLGMDVLYITTRTIHKAAQILTQKIGFKQLGVFPNVHKTKDYETHALAAIYYNNSLSTRYCEFEQHPKVLSLYNIVRENVEVTKMVEAEIWAKKDFFGEVPDLEFIQAEKFIQKRYRDLKKEDKIDLAFFPFHMPNLLITSANQEIEVYAYVNEVDKHCVITGCRINREVSFTDLFLKVSSMLRNRGIRYIEIIIRANRLNIIEKICTAKFIPCGYVPAFQLENNLRYDYIVFSRSYEILDFNNLELTGENKKYLKNYVNLWEETFLGDFFK